MIHQGLLQGCPRGGAKGVVQDLEGQVQFPVQAVPHREVPGQIGILLHLLLPVYRIFPLHPGRLSKGRLHPNLGIHIQGLKA